MFLTRKSVGIHLRQLRIVYDWRCEGEHLVYEFTALTDMLCLRAVLFETVAQCSLVIFGIKKRTIFDCQVQSPVFSLTIFKIRLVK